MNNATSNPCFHTGAGPCPLSCVPNKCRYPAKEKNQQTKTPDKSRHPTKEVTRQKKTPSKRVYVYSTNEDQQKEILNNRIRNQQKTAPNKRRHPRKRHPTKKIHNKRKHPSEPEPRGAKCTKEMRAWIRVW